MASDVSIVNQALLGLGARTINAFTDNTPEGRIANRRFNDIRDDFLRKHPWNFATKRTSLAASVVTPDWEHSNAYPVPEDFLRLLQVNNPDKIPYSIESTSDGTVIVTDQEAPLEISYIAQITDANLMDPSFRTALAWECAAEWAEKLTGSSEKVQMAELKRDRYMREARTVDGQETYPPIFDAFDWTDARE